MYEITAIEILEYFSNDFPLEMVYDLLLHRQCSMVGELILRLKEDRVLEQEGPYITYPIRWTDSFGSKDQFLIKCIIEEVDPHTPQERYEDIEDQLKDSPYSIISEKSYTSPLMKDLEQFEEINAQ